MGVEVVIIGMLFLIPDGSVGRWGFRLKGLLGKVRGLECA